MNSIETVAIASLNFDPANARKHSDKNLQAIKGSLARFGQQKPIVVDGKNIVIAGNGTLAAAKALGWSEIQVLRTALTGPEAIAFALADNRSSELAEWDLAVLEDTLRSLKDIDFPIAEIGFDLGDFLKDETKAGLTDPDEIPTATETRCKPGDLWQLGSHRVLCGDSTDVQQVDRLTHGTKVGIVYTDPPYGMKLDTDFTSMRRLNGSPGKKYEPVMGGKKYEPVMGDGEDFSPDLINTVFASFHNCDEIFLWGADYYSELLPDKNSGAWMVWDKRSNLGDSDESTLSADKTFGSVFELCWSKQKHRRQIARIRGGLFGVKDDSKSRVHPTQKPVQLAEWFIERWSKPEAIVADVYLGSGSTIIACEKLGRKCYGMEIDPHYCDVIIKRWENFTGKVAVRLEEAS